MRKFIIYLSVALFSSLTIAQPGWNWPEDEALKDQALEAQANYKDILMPQKSYNKAMKRLNWLYNNTPDLHESIYQDGATCMKEMLKGEKDVKRISNLQDSLLWMYDQRIKYFDDDADVIDRKVYEAFKLFYKDSDRYPMLDELFAKAYEMNGPNISYFNLNSYMLFAKNYYTFDPKAMTAERVLDIHSQISDIIDQKINNGGDVDRLKKEQDKTDAWLTSIDGILSCEIIEEKLVPKFREDPSNLDNAKKIFKYSLTAECTDQPYFLEASVPVFESDPSYTLARAIGGRYLASGETDQALIYFEKAFELANTNEEKHDALMGQAAAANKLGSKTKARSLAKQAIGQVPGSSEAYRFIGNLYFGSFDDCKGLESKVKDRAVFFAAYKMYQLAGENQLMANAKAQFPTIAEIFEENYEEGQEITVECWINETVTIQRR